MKNSNKSLVLCFVGLVLSTSANSHHSYAQFDRCEKFTMDGVIEQIVWSNPHVRISLNTEDGASYSVLWFDVQRLRRLGIEEGLLSVGQRITVSGSEHTDPALNIVTLVTAVERPSDGWAWSRPFPANSQRECN